MITAWQIRAGRAALGWSASDVARHAGLSWKTIQRLENIDSRAAGLASTLMAIQAALEGAGIVFIDDDGNGPGIRFRQS